MMFFVQIKKCTLKGVFGLAALDLMLFVTTLLDKKNVFLMSFFDPFKCICAQKQGHILSLLFKTRNKLCTLILAILPLNASH